MKWYNIELLQVAAEKLQQLLYNFGVDFEISAAIKEMKSEIKNTPTYYILKIEGEV